MKETIVVLLVLSLFLSGCSHKNNYNNSEESSSNNDMSEQKEETTNETDIVTPDIKGRLETLSTKLLLATDICFEENDTVDVDMFIHYFTIWEIFNGGLSIRKELEQYRTDDFSICVPKKVVNNYLLTKFAVSFSDNVSKYDSLVKEGYYDLDVETRDTYNSKLLSVKFSNNRAYITCEYIYSFDGTTVSKWEICIENYDSDNYKYIYCRDCA